MKKLGILLNCILVGLLLNAQDYILMNPIQNLMQYNPAATGLIHQNRITTTAYWGLIGFGDGAPFTWQSAYEKHIDLSRFSYGVTYTYDEVDFYTASIFKGQFSYLLVDKPDLQIALGGGLIGQHISVDFDSNIEEDPSVPRGKLTSIYAVYNTGLWLHTQRLNLGISYFDGLYRWEENYWGPYPFNLFGFISYDALCLENLKLTPEVFYANDNSYSMFHGGLMTTLYKNYRLGVLVRDDWFQTYSIGAGYKNFSADINISPNNSMSMHNMNVSLLLAYKLR